MPLNVGSRLGHYDVTALIGSGGMGVVYQATDPRLKRTVAIKLLPPGLTRDDTAKQRFLQEAQAASALDHPNICTIYEINETADGQLYPGHGPLQGGRRSRKDQIVIGAVQHVDAPRVAGVGVEHRAVVLREDAHAR